MKWPWIPALLASALALAGCGPQGGLSFAEPADRTFVQSGSPVPVVVRAQAGGIAEVVVAVDGEEVARLARGADGRFTGEIASPSAGRHRLEAWVPGLPAAPASALLFVDRAPDAPVDGEGFSPDGAWAVVLSDGRPSDDGLYAGRLTLVPLRGGPARILSEKGVAAEVSSAASGQSRRGPSDASSDEPPRFVAWLDAWSEGRGMLRLDDVRGTGPGTAPSNATDDALPRTWGGVRAFAFDGSGATFALRDDGLRVVDLYGAPGAPDEHSIAAASDAFVFVGPAVVSFAETAEDGAFAAAFGAPPDWSPVIALPRVAPLYGASPAGEVALRSFAPEGQGPGDLLLYDFATHVLEEPVDRVSAFQYSADGSWLVAIARTQTSGAGNLAVARRAPLDAAFSTVAGAFIAAAFRGDGQGVIALAEDAALVDVDLSVEPPVATAIAAGVAQFAALAGDAVLWADGAGALFLRVPDGAVIPVGALHPQRPEMAIARDGTSFAFPFVAGGNREPVRRVDVASGVAVDYGTRAHGPLLLADGALAWRETRSDAEVEEGVGGLANDDLWLAPSFPSSLFGERRAAERVGPVAVSSAGLALAVLEGMPRRGEAFAARVRCIGADFRTDDRGPADSDRRQLRFLADERLVRFGRDRDEAGVLFVETCPR